MTDERIAAIERRERRDQPLSADDAAYLLRRLREVEAERDHIDRQWREWALVHEAQHEAVLARLREVETERNGWGDTAQEYLSRLREVEQEIGLRQDALNTTARERDAAHAREQKALDNAEMNSLARTAAEERAREVEAERDEARLVQATTQALSEARQRALDGEQARLREVEQERDIEAKVNVQVVEGLSKCMAERDAARAEIRRLVEFVESVEPGVIDAFVFTENNRAAHEATK